MRHKIKSLEEIGKICEKLRKEGKKIVTTNGAFDILHLGHVKSLEKAKSFGNILIVGLNSDSSIKSYKSPDRPVVPQDQRAQMLAALEAVDYVVIFNELDPRNLLSVIKPHVHVKSKTGFKGIEREVVEGNGGEIILLDDMPGLSTTDLIKKIKEMKD